MRFENLTNDEKKLYSELLFAPLSSAQEVKDWVRGFLGLELPLEITDPDSTSSPLDAVWQVYNAFRTNSGDVNPGYILLSCREGMKTVSVAILETLLMLHFQIEIAHAAAIESQSSVGLTYISEFIAKVQPLMEFAGWVPDMANKRTIKFKTPQGKTTYIKVLICTVKGMNSLHVNALFLDELDLADPKALKQARNIVGYSKGIFGITVYLSTRKYAFGNMNDAIESAQEKNYKIIKWNILDVTEACPPKRHKPEGPKEDRYVSLKLPLRHISIPEWDTLPDSEKKKWSLVKDAYEGCITCPLLAVCQKRLAEKPETATGGFYKPIVSVIQKFKDNDPDTAEAELMCWRPGSEGLIYPRFVSQVGGGNVIDYKTAYETLMGPTTNAITELTLIQAMHDAGIQFFAGVDWGYTHDFTIIIMAMLPNGEVWVVDSFAAPGLEMADMLRVAIPYNDKYRVQAWFCDPAYPANVKTFTRNRMRSPKFTKDVMAGIEAVRSKITDGVGKRLFKIINRPENKKLITALTKHRFKLDGQGNITTEPDDERGIADLCDALRYLAQNKFPIKGTQRPSASWAEEQAMEQLQNPNVTQQMKQEIASRVTDAGGNLTNTTSRKGGFHWNF
jgi:hypothetical protein